MFPGEQRDRLESAHRRFAISRRAISTVAVVSAALPVRVGLSVAEQYIGSAEVVVSEVRGALSSDRNVNVLQGDAVFRDEAVRTDGESTVKLLLRDSAGLSLGPFSSVKLDHFVYDGPDQPGSIAVNFVKGALRFATGNADKQAYTITTPTTTLGVRSAILKLDATASKTNALLQEGAVAVRTRRSAVRHCAEMTMPGQSAVVTVMQVALQDPSGASVAFAHERSLGLSNSPRPAPAPASPPAPALAQAPAPAPAPSYCHGQSNVGEVGNNATAMAATVAATAMAAATPIEPRCVEIRISDLILRAARTSASEYAQTKPQGRANQLRRRPS